jgi:Ras-related protein Rab-1A
LNVTLRVFLGGRERFRVINASYYRGAHGVLVFYDVTDKGSWENVKNWLQESERYASDNVPMLVVGTKIDLLDSQRRAVPIEEVLKFCEERNLEYCECSSKTGQGVEAAYARIVAQATTDRWRQIEQSASASNVNVSKKKRSKEKCAVM